MPGFESNRFVGLPQRMQKHLICSICLNIYNNAVKSECEHTFCKSCVQNLIENNHKECPECRTGFTSRKRTTRMTTDLNLVIICEFIFKNNLTANNIINELKVKCDFESNGCQEEIELGLLSTHLLKCEHRLCKTCGFTLGRDVEHNCLEILKRDKNQLKAKLNEITDKNRVLEERIQTNENEWTYKLNEMIDKNKKLEEEMNNKTNEMKLKVKEMEEKVKEINGSVLKTKNNSQEVDSKEDNQYSRLEEFNTILDNFNKNLIPKPETDCNKEMITLLRKQFLSNLLSTQSIYFGTLLTQFSKIYLNDFGFYFNSTDYQNSVSIKLESIEELKFCSDPSFPVIILKTDSQSCDEIRERIQLTEPSKGWLNVRSDDQKEKYIVIKCCSQTSSVNQLMRISLVLHSFHRKPDRICLSIDLNEAKHMFNSVSNPKTTQN